jgi:hypothetical protein
MKMAKEDESSRYEAQTQELIKENSLLKDRKKKLEEELRVIEQEKE